MMSTLTVINQDSLGHLRVEVDAADTNATCAQVIRSNDSSPLRTHVWGCDTLGEWQHLSDGQAVFFDTEAPVDTPFTYTVLLNLGGPTITGGPFTLNSLNGMWLRDPLRPCNDVRVIVGKILPKPACDTTSAVYWQSFADENYAANAGMFLPTNARRGIPITRTRRDVDTTLTLLTRRFTDRDAVLTLLQPGSPYQFTAPTAYGVPTRYFQAHDVSVTRLYQDHRKQNRDVTIPSTAVDRPIGPAQGVCGSRIDDLCAVYPSWLAVSGSALSWWDLERGKAGSGFVETATWNSVKAGFANWTAVAAKTWNQIRTGT